MRRLHRWLGLTVAAFLFLIAGSGIWIQFEPDKANEIASTRLSDTKIEQAFRKSLLVAGQNALHGKINMMLMNVSGVTPHVLFGLQSAGAELGLTLDAQSGMPIVDANAFHAWLLRLHSTFMLGKPGNFLSLLSGVALLCLCITACVLYFRMWRIRARGGRHAPFWGWQRGQRLLALHRGGATIAIIFLCIIASSGICMQVFAPTPPAGDGVSVDDIPSLNLPLHLAESLSAAEKLSPDGDLGLIMLDLRAPRPEFVLTYQSSTLGWHDLIFDAQSVALQPAKSNFYFKILQLHRGDLIGPTGIWFNIMSGVFLMTLTFTGVSVYIRSLRRRMHAGL